MLVDGDVEMGESFKIDVEFEVEKDVVFFVVKKEFNFFIDFELCKDDGVN